MSATLQHNCVKHHDDAGLHHAAAAHHHFEAASMYGRGDHDSARDHSKKAKTHSEAA